MKLKKVISGLLLFGIVLIPCFSFAVNNVNDLGEYEDLGGNLCTIYSDLSFDCENSNNVIVGTDAGRLQKSSSYFWTNSGLAYYIYNNYGVFDNGQGYVSSFKVCGGTANCNNPSSMSYNDFVDYYNNNTLTAWEWFSAQSSPGRAGPMFIFGDTYIYFTPVTSDGNTIILWYGGITPYSFGLVGWGLDADYKNVINSPVSKPAEFYYSTGSCPSVGQIKSSYNLTPDVCYAGFSFSDMFGDGSSVYFAGSGVDIFQVYNMYSGGMLLQAWYDTYWNYYQDINHNVDIFEGKSKALLGTFFSRQTFGKSLGSFPILNYCYYIINDIPDNSSSCVSSNVSTNYSGVVFDSKTREDILDSIIGWEESVRIQTGFDTGDLTDIYNQSYSLFSSRTIDPGFNGIIPSYIVIGFLGIVLLYFLRR